MISQLVSSSKFKEWVSDQINKAILKCGSIVNSKTAQKRMDQCLLCEHKIKVRIKPSLPEVDGCDKCGGCPLATKTRLEWIYRIEGKEDDPLSENEVATVNMYIKMGLTPPNKYKKIKIECPENKWEN